MSHVYTRKDFSSKIKRHFPLQRTFGADKEDNATISVPYRQKGSSLIRHIETPGKLHGYVFALTTKPGSVLSTFVVVIFTTNTIVEESRYETKISLTVIFPAVLG